jgi:hypothetical protein
MATGNRPTGKKRKEKGNTNKLTTEQKGKKEI